MKIQIITIITILMVLPFIFAMYGGETEVIEFDFETDNCTVIGNETGIDFNFTGNQAIVKPAINYIGNFTITCYDWLTKEEETHSSGGNGVTIKDWSAKCGYNLECLYGKANLTTTENVVEPEVVQDDVVVIEEEIEKSYGWVWILIVIIVLMVIVGIIFYFKGNGDGEGFTG